MKKFFIFLSPILLLLAVVLASPRVTKALTMQDLLNAKSLPNRGMVLSASSPSADINGDGIVNSLDAVILINHFGQNYAPADLNSDGIVNSADYSILASQWFYSK